MDSVARLDARVDELLVPELAEEVKGRIREDEAARMLPPASTGGYTTYGMKFPFVSEPFYQGLPWGRFSGRLIVEWDGLSDDMPRFVFRPNPQAPFRYTTASGRVIEPRLMLTDGGSVPRVLHGLARYSPWRFGPAYIIHDWIFAAHKCKFAPDSDISFEHSALILAEAIKTLTVDGYETHDGARRHIAKDEDTLYSIYRAVESSKARAIWDDLADTECLA